MRDRGFKRDALEKVGGYAIIASFLFLVVYCTVFLSGNTELVYMVIGYVLGEMRGLVVGRGEDSTFEGHHLNGNNNGNNRREE